MVELDRRWIPRIAAPAAFLLGVTVAVVLVRAGMDSDGATTAVVETSVATATAPATTARTTTAQTPQPVFATVESGDTLDQIAAEHDTTVERILELNAGLDPTALQIGQRIRVR